MNSTDFHALRARIAEAATQGFQALRIAYPKRSIYAFALYTTDDCPGIVPVANSEQSYKDTVDKISADASYKALLNRIGVPLERSLLGDYRWSPFEWVTEQVEPSGFRAAGQIISRLATAVPDQDPLGFVKFKAGVLAAMVLGLGDAAKSGTFDDRAAGAAVTLCCSVADSEAAIFLEADSARRLNSDAAFNVYRRERLAYIGEVDPADEADPESLYNLYLAQVGQK